MGEWAERGEGGVGGLHEASCTRARHQRVWGGGGEGWWGGVVQWVSEWVSE